VLPGLIGSEIGSFEPVGRRSDLPKYLIYTVKHFSFMGVSPFRVDHFPGFPKSQKV
jgi:hypothetical protein